MFTMYDFECVLFLSSFVFYILGILSAKLVASFLSFMREVVIFLKNYLVVLFYRTKKKIF